VKTFKIELTNQFIMKWPLQIIIINLLLMFGFGCKRKNPPVDKTAHRMEITAADMLGNPEYRAISYGGYRQLSRDVQPTVDQLKEDMRLLNAMGVHLIRTYNTHYDQAANILKAIRELNELDPNFEMYVMLGAWIDCADAWTAHPNHTEEDLERNSEEILRAAALAREYPEVVKIIAVGNEAMVKWAWSYYVQPWVILKWVNHLQALKAKGELPDSLWITSSDNFASWGGGGQEYHVEDLRKLWKAVDFVSMHTYPMHDTHYNPTFWGLRPSDRGQGKREQVEAAMKRARDYAVAQYDSVLGYMRHIGAEKPIHIGETGWASYANELYGDEGSRACDEYKMGLYYKYIREWTESEGLSCFYFEAFDEPWKDAANPGGSENHFGLINLRGEAKYPIWELVDQGVFTGLKRDGQQIGKTFDGRLDSLLQYVQLPPELGSNSNTDED